ncbi:MAG TPA: LLM class flavin-dependent oxidoreductase [Acidimicrobiales bacterium]|nr:LLM class flavin-dependent oxidoreductase [Acidimicrobiales bacterium]
MAPLEFWTHARTLPRLVGPTARQAEAEGWTGVTLGDSQNMSGDPFVAFGTVAAVTTTLRLTTGVTNPYTRHPAVTASAILCADIESSGRVELGVGRGDSALAHIGLPPVSVAAFRDFLEMQRLYLTGAAVPIDQAAQGVGRRVGAGLPLGIVPKESRMLWLDELRQLGVDPGTRTVPIWTAATGPKVIQTAAELGDRVTFALGADPKRVGWGVDLARSARSDVALGAIVTVVVDDDRDRAFALSRGGIATFVRFSAMHGRVHGLVSERDAKVMLEVPKAYDMYKHARTGPQAEVIDREFAERFAILGPAGYCVDRLLELAALGIDRFHIGGASRGEDPEMADAVNRRFVEQVMPQLV